MILGPDGKEITRLKGEAIIPHSAEAIREATKVYPAESQVIALLTSVNLILQVLKGERVNLAHRKSANSLKS